MELLVYAEVFVDQYAASTCILCKYLSYNMRRMRKVVYFVLVFLCPKVYHGGCLGVWVGRRVAGKVDAGYWLDLWVSLCVLPCD